MARPSALAYPRPLLGTRFELMVGAKRYAWGACCTTSSGSECGSHFAGRRVACALVVFETPDAS